MIQGIDVSVYQGLIIWHNVASAGYHFAGMKATEGLGFEDPRFPRNWSHSKEHGVRRIAYHFFHADLAGGRQADYFHSVVHAAGGFKAGDCAMVDVETTNGVSGQNLVQSLEVFIDRFLSTTQCGLYIYTSRYFWDSVLGAPRSAIVARCPLWDATWGTSPSIPSLWPHGASIWQYSASGRVPGIEGDVDMDRFLGTSEQYDLLARKGGRE